MTSKWLTREVTGWAFYDFANSAFATTVLAVVFNVYFVQVVVGPNGAAFFNKSVPGESLWGYTVALSTFFTFLLAPLVGAICDQYKLKKVFLGILCSLGALATALLFLATPGRYLYASSFFILANVGFTTGNSLYNAFLPELSDSKTVGRVSGFGWALGYIGGGLCLALNLAMIKAPGLFGIPDKEHIPVRAAISICGIWWLTFSLPLFLWVKERRIKKIEPTGFTHALRSGLSRLKETITSLKNQTQLLKFMISYLIYNDGIETVIVMASIFAAKELGMVQGSLVLCFLMIQSVAFLGALGFGWLADKIGHKRSIFITLVIYIAVLIAAGIYVKTQTGFWILGAIIGLILGGSQAASRSMLTLMIPAEKAGEYFGFFALAGKLATVFGPFVFALTAQIWNLRIAILSLIAFFVAGGIMLYGVKEPEKVQAT